MSVHVYVRQALGRLGRMVESTNVHQQFRIEMDSWPAEYVFGATSVWSRRFWCLMSERAACIPQLAFGCALFVCLPASGSATTFIVVSTTIRTCGAQTDA
jgi:hypothetical protein